MSKSWQKIIIMVAAALALVCTFLPWYSASAFGISMSVNIIGWPGKEFIGVLYLLLALATTAMAVVDFILSKKVTRLINAILAMVSAGVFAIFIFMFLGETVMASGYSAAMSSASSFGVSAGVGVGLIGAGICAAGLIAGGILTLLDKNHDKDGMMMNGGMNNMMGGNMGMNNMNGQMNNMGNMNNGMMNGGMNNGQMNGQMNGGNMNGMNGMGM